MNCENFNDLLPEYLDETLTALEQSDFREHIQKCADCRQALARQEAFAKSMRGALNREAEGLSLHPKVRQNILAAAQPRDCLPSTSESFRAFFNFLRRPFAWAGAVLICLLLLVSVRHFHSQAIQHAVGGIESVCVVDVPIQTETPVSRMQDNMALDALVTRDSLIDLSFCENVKPSAALKPHIN